MTTVQLQIIPQDVNSPIAQQVVESLSIAIIKYLYKNRYINMDNKDYDNDMDYKNKCGYFYS